MSKAFHLSVDDKGIGRLVFDLPNEKVNKFCMGTMTELDKVLDSLARNNNIRALVISSGKPGCFIAGADIEQFTKVESLAEAEDLARKGQQVFQHLAMLPFPTISVIDGVCLGGGMEFALACDYRLVSDDPKTSLGLPEVSLGLIPGWGGTQRLPKIVGLTQALPMILGGRAVDARKAYKIKLADGIAPKEFLDEKILDFVDEVLSSKGKEAIKKKRKSRSFMSCFLEGNPIGRALVFNRASKDVLSKTKGLYPAPLKALNVIKNTQNMPIEEGLVAEAKGIAGCFEGTIARNLIDLFFIGQMIKKDSGVEKKVEGKAIRTAGVLGAGVMGGGIAWLFSKKDIPVRLKDVNWEGVSKGFESASKIYHQMLKIRKIKPHEINLKMHRISGTIDYSGFNHLDLVVEAVVENLDVKKQVLKELEEHVADDVIICSNTSALSITEMATAMEHPERFVGMHFFNPVNRMPLVEVVPGKKTSPETVASVVSLVKKLGKTPIVVKDCAGFLVNRILLPYLSEAGWLLQEGVDFEKMDKVIEKFGMPMGPALLIDEIGIDVACKAAKNLEEAYGERMAVPGVFVKISDAGLLGKKGKKGFYLHKGKKRSRNGEIDKLNLSTSSSGTEFNSKEIEERMIFTMINEAVKCLEERVVEKPEYLDMAMIMGTGFPPFRGGLLKYADSVGIGYVAERIVDFHQKYGERFKPAELLIKMKDEGKNFYNQKKG